MRPIWILCVLFMATTTGGAVAAQITKSSAWKATPSKQKAVSRRPRANHYLFGDRRLERSRDSSRGGIAESVPFTNRTTGTARELHVYVGARNRARTLVIGLYSNRNGRPGALLASGTRVSPQRGKWNTVTLRPRVRRFRSRTVHGGSTYWIAVLGKKGRLAFRSRTGGQCRSVTSVRRSLARMPMSWKTGRTSARCPISAYVTGAVSKSRSKPQSPGNSPANPAPAPPAIPAPPSGLPPINCDLHATPATFSAEVSAAVAGQTVCLAAGDYGTWAGTTKAITIAPEPGASPTLNFDFRANAANFTINGGHNNYDSTSPGINLVDENYFDAGSSNITLEGVGVTCDGNNSFCVQVVTGMPGIVIKDNVFHDMLYPNTASAALWLRAATNNPANVLVENNVFRDMGADAIDGGTATIIGNNFFDIDGSNPNDPRHTDVIQYDQNAIIEGNFVDNGCTQGIAAYDGTSGNTITDNVIVGCSVHSLVAAADTPGSLVAHNTVIGAGGLECGSKTGSPPSTTQVRDNILQQGINWGGVQCTPSVDQDNMSWPSFGQIHSSSDFIGTPRFAGGSNPSTYAGYALAAGSPGKGRASDSGDVGARVGLYPRPAGLQ